MSNETENNEDVPDEPDATYAGMIATVWRIPGEVPAEGRTWEVPDRLPEFWVREHRVPSHLSRPQVRDVPYILRGRDHETAFMAQQVHGMPKPVQLIHGPPGAGKTSLLHNIGRYAAAQGYRVIELDHAAFDSHTALSDAFRNIVNAIDRTPATTTVTVGESGGANVAGVERGGHATTTHTHDLGRAEQWMDAIRKESANPEHRGLLILLDEVQLLKSHTEGSEQYKRIRAFLQFMHNTILKDSSSARDQVGLRTMLICAGMPDAEQTLLHYGLTRVEGKDTLRMGPIDDYSSREIIMDHMTAATEDGRMLPQLPESSIKELVELCGGFAHHISHAAQNAQRQAMQAALRGRAELTADDLNEIFEETKIAKELHYEKRVRDNTPTERITVSVQVVAQSTLSWGDQLPQESVDELVKLIMAKGDANTDNLLRDLIAYGILEPRRLPSGYPTAVVPEGGREAHYVFAIHSMQKWLLDRLESAERQFKRKEANQKMIDAVAEHRDPGDRIPPWAWNHGKQLPELEPMPPDEPWQPVAVEPIGELTPKHSPGAGDRAAAEATVATAEAVAKSVRDKAIPKARKAATKAKAGVIGWLKGLFAQSDDEVPLVGGDTRHLKATGDGAKNLLQATEKLDAEVGQHSAAHDGRAKETDPNGAPGGEVKGRDDNKT